MRTVLLPFLLLLTPLVQAGAFQSSPAVAEIFEQSGFNGTFVLYDVSADSLSGFNQARAETRYIPASTFKIANTLIGLSSGAVSSVDEVFVYDGKPVWLPEWAHDMGLRQAIKVSNVPVYQALARRIGLQRMQAGVSALEYGNRNIGQVVDNFWLEGPLTISAVEQTRFLARLASGQLPFPAQAQAQTREIAELERGDGWVLYGKTGWLGKSGKIGWWVGWVEQHGKVYSFALNIDMPELKDAAQRQVLGKASLKALGLL